jgi:hypothetical protein
MLLQSFAVYKQNFAKISYCKMFVRDIFLLNIKKKTIGWIRISQNKFFAKEHVQILKNFTKVGTISKILYPPYLQDVKTFL